MKKAALYARVSTATGIQDFERQVTELLPVIKSHGYSDDQIISFKEMVSGFKSGEERVELQKMLETIDANPQEEWCVYVTEISRLGRKPEATREIIDMLTQKSIPVFVNSLKQFTLVDGRRNSIMNIILQVLIEYASMEAETTKQRSKSGLRHRAQQGFYHGGVFLPYGYMRQEKRLVVNEPEAEIVRMIYKLYLQGQGSKIISHHLNDLKVTTRYQSALPGGEINYGAFKKPVDSIRWSDKQVLDILTNSIYIGKRKFDGGIVDCPTIIDEETFYRAQEIRESKTTRNNITTYTYLLKGKIKCGKCGSNYYGRVNLNKGEKSYKCASTLYKGNSCGNQGVNIDVLESLVFYLLATRKFLIKYVASADILIKKLSNERSILVTQLNQAKTQISKTIEERKRIVTAFRKGYIKNDDLQSEILSIDNSSVLFQNQIEQINQRLAKIEEALSNQGIANSMKKLRTSSRVELEGLFQSVIAKILIKESTSKVANLQLYFALNGEPTETFYEIEILLDTFRSRNGKRLFKAIYRGKYNEDDPDRPEIELKMAIPYELPVIEGLTIC